MPATPETQFTLFDRPSSLDGYQAPRQRRRAHLPDLVQAVGELENEELIDLIRVAIGEARRRGIGSATSASDSNQGTAPAVEQMPPARIIRKAAATPDIPPAKASMVRAAVRAGFSPARVAKDFGVSVAMVRKLAAT
jgi:DNA-directed RNA polymerase specialized sigma24 family protein